MVRFAVGRLSLKLISVGVTAVILKLIAPRLVLPGVETRDFGFQLLGAALQSDQLLAGRKRVALRRQDQLVQVANFFLNLLTRAQLLDAAIVGAPLSAPTIAVAEVTSTIASYLSSVADTATFSSQSRLCSSVGPSP